MGKRRLEIEEGEEVVRRTIVGGRPAARPNNKLRVPVGIEKVLYRAAVERDFRELLFKDRRQAIEASGFELLESEAHILTSVPSPVLKGMVAKVDVRRHTPGRFMRAVAGCALAATTALVAVDCGSEAEMGVRPEAVIENPGHMDAGGARPEPGPEEVGTREPVKEAVIENPGYPDAGGARPD